MEEKDEISNRILIKVTEWRNILFTVFSTNKT